jgi:acyl-CoA:acyl-CoA alkyltransferase
VSVTRFQHVCLEALVHEEPAERLLSSSIEAQLAATYQRLGIPIGCIETLVGVQARRVWSASTPIDVLASRVAEAAVARRPDLRGAIGACVSTSVSKDFVEPSVAALVAGALSLSTDCQTLDVSNACLGFLSGMEHVARRIECGEIDVGLIVAAESSRAVLSSTIDALNAASTTMADYKMSLPTLTLRLHGMVTKSDPSSSRICMGTPTSMHTDAPALLKNGVALAERTYAEAQEHFGWNRTADVDHYVCHQVGAGHMTTLFARLSLPLSRARLTFPQYGNVGPAAVPMTLGMLDDDGALSAGDRIALMGIGSGLNVAMLDMTW